MILSTAREIDPADLELHGDVAVSAGLPFGATVTLADVERQWILTTLDRCGGNQSAAAAVLGIDRTTLHRKLRQYGD